MVDIFISQPGIIFPYSILLSSDPTDNINKHLHLCSSTLYFSATMFSKLSDPTLTARRKRVLESCGSQFEYFSHLLGHIWTKREDSSELKFRFETEFKKRFNYTENTTEFEFNSLHQNVPLEEIYQQFLEIEQMEHDRIEAMSPESKKVAKKSKKKRQDREKFAISNLLSPDRMAETRRLDREKKKNRRSDALERERYNASQATLQANRRSDPSERESYNASQATLQANRRSDPSERESYNASRAMLQANRRSDPSERESYNASQAALQVFHRSDPSERERYNTSQAALQSNLRSHPSQRQRYNESQTMLYHRSLATRNNNICATTAIHPDEDGGYEETKHNSPLINDATQPLEHKDCGAETISATSSFPVVPDDALLNRPQKIRNQANVRQTQRRIEALANRNVVQRQRRTEAVTRRRGNVHTFRNVARQYSIDEIHKLGDIQPHYVGRMDQTCNDCGAFFLESECN